MHAGTWLTGLALIALSVPALAGPPSPRPGTLDDVPADIRAILERGGPKTSAETERVRAWGLARVKTQHGVESGPAPAGDVRALASAVVPILKPEVRLAAEPPSPTAYRALLESTIQRLRGRLQGAAGTAADRLLGAGKGLEAIGTLLTVAGAAPDLAALVLAHVARAAPDDALAASNLGVALRNAGEGPDAWTVLARAAALRPKAALVAVNQAYVALDAGDGPSAERLFAKALAGTPADPLALAGQGLLRLAQGRRDEGVRLLGAAVRAGYAGSAELALIDDTAANAEEAHDAQRARATTTPDGASSVGQDGPVWEVRVGYDQIPASAEAFTREAPIWTQRIDDARREAEAGERALTEARKALIRAEGAPPEGLGPVLVLPRRFAAARLALLMLNQRTDDALEGPVRALAELSQLDAEMFRAAEFEKQVRALYASCATPECFSQLAETKCNSGRTKAQQLHSGLLGAYLPAMMRIANHLRARTAASAQHLRQITAPEANRYENLVLREGVRKRLANLHVVPTWLTLLGMYQMTCPRAGVPQALPSANADATAGAGEAPCRQFVFSIGVASLEIDCRKVKVEVGEGLLGGVEVQWAGTASGQPSTKFFAGAGVQAGAGPVDATVKGVMSVTYEAGAISDVGFEAGVEAEAGPVGLESGVTWSHRQHLESGPEGGLSRGFSYSGVDGTLGVMKGTVAPAP